MREKVRSPKHDLDELDAQNLRRQLRVIDSESGVVNFASNDYLGLANDPALKAAFTDAIEKVGAGSGASRLICGTHRPHAEFEEQLAEFKNTESALLFGSGYATATGAIPAIVGKGDVVILDKLCHASLIDGAKLSGATMRVFPHNDLGKLESHLRWANEQVAGKKGRILVLTESVFSMDGDRAPLQEIVRLKQEHDARLFVDEAHAFGILGPRGRGLAAELDCDGDVDFQMGTLSKAAGLSGGYLCASRDWIDLIVNRARSFIYSTAPPPALAAAAGECLRLIGGKRGEEMRGRLFENISQFQADAESAIIPVVLGENETALAAADALLESGYFVPAIRFPTVPRGTARLRVTVSAAHSAEEIAGLKSALSRLRKNE
ncbi:MAG: 8-amino-7-oxononanoate synthase [Verrucomicrobiales bacterium]|nr:8-amino-7-oxononanoate synthase [Verrucomicrobiales bacterium]